LTGDGAISLREIARRIGKPYVALPAALLGALLWLLRAFGLSSRGPEQVNFLRYRPVLSNQRLKSELGFIPTYTSEQCFEHYRRLRFPEQDAGRARSRQPKA
jgi:UDP-glucose 4-epimerase